MSETLHTEVPIDARCTKCRQLIARETGSINGTPVFSALVCKNETCERYGVLVTVFTLKLPLG